MKLLTDFSDISSQVKVKTGDVDHGSTDAKVTLRIYGSLGDTGPLQLDQSLNHSDPFHRNYIDTFILTAPVIGQIEKIKIGHDNSGIGPGWYVETITIDIPSEGRRYVFLCHRWLSVSDADGATVTEFYPTSGEDISYQVEVKTGDEPGAETAANITLIIYGSRGSTGPLQLDQSLNHSDPFQRNYTDTFILTAPIETIKIGHDNSGIDPEWYVETITIDVPSAGRRFIKKIKIGHDNSGIGPGWYLGTVTIDFPSESRRYEFVCNRWLSKSDDDGQIVRELQPTSSEDILYQYQVEVKTVDVVDAGTDAKVTLIIYGSCGDTGPLQLDQSLNHADPFQRNYTDTFILTVPVIGQVRKLDNHRNKD
ncbi:hypothetical protein LOTGIDRAFT_145236 [Lottia gigantea]|uniref:PLAT domain-containing protein n=1 Tax=Lottia gigantea TaxID=225164 RepID=V4AKI6_LOTGI|nr:hypothetical protein LOTGIDRAFT_145236 [Lottia gigantea]ESO94071.1 hypothetical protein LOTGIDRAFT_145236 [Lottia gigantea]